MGQRLRSQGFLRALVHNTAATRGQYLTLSNAWQSCNLYKIDDVDGYVQRRPLANYTCKYCLII